MHVYETVYLTKLNTHTLPHTGTHTHSHADTPTGIPQQRENCKFISSTKKKWISIGLCLIVSLRACCNLLSVCSASWLANVKSSTHTHIQSWHTHTYTANCTHSYTLRVNVKLNSFLAFGRLVSSHSFPSFLSSKHVCTAVRACMCVGEAAGVAWGPSISLRSSSVALHIA